MIFFDYVMGFRRIGTGYVPSFDARKRNHKSQTDPFIIKPNGRWLTNFLAICIKKEALKNSFSNGVLYQIDRDKRRVK